MASTNVGKWSVTAGVDAGAFGTGVNAMTRDTARMEQSVKKGFTGMEQAVDGALGGVGASISLFGMRVGFQSLSMASVVNSIKQLWSGLSETLESDLELGFLADQLGVSVEWLSALQTVASENSVTAEQFSSGMQRLNQTLGQANLGSSEAVRSFEQLGLSFDVLRSMRPEQQFMAVANALANTEDRSVRARSAMEIFGRGGAGAMLRFVDDINRSLGDVQERGAFLTTADLENFNRLDDSIDRIGTRWNQLWRDFLGATAPMITRVLEGWQAILFHQEPVLMNVAQDVNQRIFESLAQQYRDTGNEFFLRLDREGPIGHLIEQGLRVPTEFTVGGMDGILDADAVLRAMNRTADETAASLEGVNIEMNRLREQNRTAGLLADITEADRIFEQTRNPIEQFEARIERLIFLFNEGNLSADTFGRAVDQALGALSGAGERRLPGILTFGSAAAATQVNQTQAQIRDRMDTLIGVSRETRDALRDILRANPEVQGILQGGA